jgi:hypothetical protein
MTTTGAVEMVAKTQSKSKIFLAQLVVVLVIALIVIGIACYDLSATSRARLWQNIVDRPGGPMNPSASFFSPSRRRSPRGTTVSRTRSLVGRPISGPL